ncbi:MAG: ABC transporter ATP-binding protein [Hungateiclostridium thermocellum]|nr:ABC transporter ATP-binding protein [Acetivibrio thermocellus]
MKYLISIARENKAIIFLYIAIGLAYTFLQNFSSRYFQKIIDNFANNTLTITNIAIYGSALLALYILCYLQIYPERKLEHGIELSLKIKALRKLSVIDYLSYVKIGTGTLIQRIENGAAAGSNILFGFYLRLANDLLPQILFSIVFIYALDPRVMIAILFGYVIVFIVTNLLLKALYKVKANILLNEERFNHLIVRGFMEMVVFRVNRRFEHEIKKAEAASGEIIGSKVKMKLIHEAFFTIFVILVSILKIGIIVYGWINANIVILDEATSAIDNLTEEAIMKNVMDLLSGRTVIAIAHRLESIRTFDKIIVFQNGCVVEQGRFDELIEKQQYFYELYNRAAQNIDSK